MARPVLRVLLISVLLLAPAGAAPDETAGFLPKDDLGVAAYQAEHPEADGRGVLVAVLDTGVDLLHPALQRTPDGETKIVDYHDATDAGLVATTFEAALAEGRTTGLSGRRLTLPTDAPAQVRLGLVRSGEIYPGRLLGRLRRERKEERDEARRLATDLAHGGKAPPAPFDPGDPVHDLALWRTDDGWRLVVDTDEDGDLTDETVLREYGVAQDVAVLAARTRLAFGFEVRRDGDAVSLLFDGGGHGTHVAGIIAGYHGEGSPLNGLAPGARILAVKIGNGRFGGATTHLALIRGLEWAGRKGADVVNISFGGPSLFADGREVSAAFVNDAVEKYGYAVCLSAGNAGPTLGTVGSPATSRRAISVGAWCSTATQASNYGVVHPRAGALFAFSSRGPLPTGAAGVDFIAPGAAVSSVPEWSLVAGRNMNGTSMAAPQASGALAVIVSSARQEKLALSPARLRVALRRCARPQPGLTMVEQGYGLIDVEGTMAALRRMSAEPEPVEWIVEDGGVLDRALLDDAPFDVERRLSPDFAESTPAERVTRFQRMLRLVSDVPWLEPASPVHASGGGTTVRARIVPERMSRGLNVGVIRAVDIQTGLEEARIPITLIRPRIVPEGDVWVREALTILPGEKKSIFLRVPPGATQVRVETSETAREGGTRLAFRSTDRHAGPRSVADDDALPAGGVSVRHHAVIEGTTLEVAFHRPFAGTPEPSAVSAAFCFRGVVPDVREVRIPLGRLGTHVNIRACGDVSGRFEAEAGWSEEPLSIAWTTVRDPDAPLLVGEDVVFRHDGTASIDVPEDRAEVRIDLGFETPFEDYLDDGTYEIEDANGRNVDRGLIWTGPFSFRPPHRGRFRVHVRVWERGRSFFRDGGMFSPTLLRKIKPRRLETRQDVFEGFSPGGPSGRAFRLNDGDRIAALLLRPGGAGAVRGTVRFIDEGWNVTLFERRLRVDPPATPDAVKGLADGFEQDLRAAIDADATTVATRESLAGRAAMMRSAKLATPAMEADLLRLEARRGADEAGAAISRLDEIVKSLKPGRDLDAVLRARAEIRLISGDVDGAKADLDRAGGEAEDEIRVRALIADRTGQSQETLKLLDRLEKTAPPRASAARLRFRALVALGRRAEAARFLGEWTERFPALAGEVAEMARALADSEAKDGE